MSVAGSWRWSRSGDGAEECAGARVSAQCRSVAAVITVTGGLHETNVEVVAGCLGRFVLLGAPLILDITGVEVRAGGWVGRLVSIFDAECHLGDVEWVLVAKPADDHLLGLTPQDEHVVMVADSVTAAVAHFVMAIHTRRHLPLCG